MLHTKAMLVDDDLAIIGSANFDARSFRLNFEVSVMFRDAAVAAELARLIEGEFAHGAARARATAAVAVDGAPARSAGATAVAGAVARVAVAARPRGRSTTLRIARRLVTEPQPMRCALARSPRCPGCSCCWHWPRSRSRSRRLAGTGGAVPAGRAGPAGGLGAGAAGATRRQPQPRRIDADRSGRNCAACANRPRRARAAVAGTHRPT